MGNTINKLATRSSEPTGKKMSKEREIKSSNISAASRKHLENLKRDLQDVQQVSDQMEANLRKIGEKDPAKAKRYREVFHDAAKQIGKLEKDIDIKSRRHWMEDKDWALVHENQRLRRNLDAAKEAHKSFLNNPMPFLRNGISEASIKESIEACKKARAEGHDAWAKFHAENPKV